MKICVQCGKEITPQDGDHWMLCFLCSTCAENVANKKRLRRNALARARHQAMLDCGLVRVKGALGGTYYE